MKKNVEDVRAYLGVERTEEEKSGSFEDLDVPWAAGGSAGDVKA